MQTWRLHWSVLPVCNSPGCWGSFLPILQSIRHLYSAKKHLYNGLKVNWLIFIYPAIQVLLDLYSYSAIRYWKAIKKQSHRVWILISQIRTINCKLPFTLKYYFVLVSMTRNWQFMVTYCTMIVKLLYQMLG